MEEKDNQGSRIRFDRVFMLLAVIAVMIAAAAYGLMYYEPAEREREQGIYYTAVTGKERQAEASDTAADEENQATETEASVVSVFVCGAVMVPDVYELDKNALVKDAVQAAGGFSDEADVSYRNLAEKVTDGEKIYIPTVDETAGSGQPDGEIAGIRKDTDDDSADSRININTATLAQLKTLPGIGDAKAEAVIAYREAHGGFQSTEEIMQVSGIKEALYSRIKDYITI